METNKTALWTKHWLEKRNIPHSFLKEVSSTNTLAKQKAFTGYFKNHIFLTTKQTQGRGQGFHQWENSDLMITWLWEDTFRSVYPKLIDELILELLNSAQKIWPNLPWEVKKSNDLYLENKKVAGLLLEVLDQSSKKAFVLGLGFNVFSHPKLSDSKNSLQAGHLQEHTDVTKESWELFMDNLHKLWTKKILNI